MPQSVTPRPTESPRPDMSAMGMLVAAGSLFLLLPLAPFLLALKVLDWVRGTDSASDLRRRADRRDRERSPGAP